MSGNPMTVKRFHGFRRYAVVFWALLPAISLVFLYWLYHERTEYMETVSVPGGSGGQPISASVARPVSAGTVHDGKHPVLLIHAPGKSPAGLLPLLDEIARQGSFAMSCALPSPMGSEAVGEAVAAFVELCGIESADLWLVAAGTVAEFALDYTEQHDIRGLLLVDPELSPEYAASVPEETPIAILAASRGGIQQPDRLTALFETLSGEDATIGESASGTGKVLAHTFLSPDGFIRLTTYGGIPRGLGLMSPGYRNDVLRWIEADGRVSSTRSSTLLLLPLDIMALFVAGALISFLAFGSASRLLPKDPVAGQSPALTGLLAAGVLAVACAAFGLIGRVLWSRPLMWWQAAAAGVAVLAIRLAIYGFLSLARGWSRSVDLFINRGLDGIDLMVFLVVAGGAALLAGGSVLVYAFAGTGALCAWGYGRAAGALSRSLIFSHFAGALILAVTI